jgi:hypothetical protein
MEGFCRKKQLKQVRHADVHAMTEMAKIGQNRTSQIFKLKNVFTVDDLIPRMKLSKIASTYSVGGVTADRMYSTAELYDCSSELSFNSDMRSISGL